MAGFSAIVVLFKRSESGSWNSYGADLFNGMVLHSMSAAFFCILPSLLDPFVSDPALTWSIASGLLGIQIVFHAGVIFTLPSSTTGTRVTVGIGGLAAASVQLLNAIGVGFANEFPPYLVGILWHLFQAGTLFVGLIWVRASDVDDEEPQR